jgi:hypothetical protein
MSNEPNFGRLSAYTGDPADDGRLLWQEAASTGAEAVLESLGSCLPLGDGVPVRVDHVEPVRVDGQPHTFALGYLARFDDRRRTRLTVSVERDDDLAVGAALLDVRQRLESLVEGERLVDDRAEVAGVIEGGQLAQLGTVGLHEQERVAHT